MIVIGIILILLFSLLLYLLLAPLRLGIDTTNNDYFIRMKGVANIALIPENGVWFMVLKIGLWKKKFRVFQLVRGFSQNKTTKKERKRKEKLKRFDFVRSMKVTRRVLSSFRVKVCKIMIDTDDYYWNALLIPALQWMSRDGNHWIAVNFERKNQVVLLIENRLINLLYSILFRK